MSNSIPRVLVGPHVPHPLGRCAYTERPCKGSSTVGPDLTRLPWRCFNATESAGVRHPPYVAMAKCTMHTTTAATRMINRRTLFGDVAVKLAWSPPPPRFNVMSAALEHAVVKGRAYSYAGPLMVGSKRSDRRSLPGAIANPGPPAGKSHYQIPDTDMVYVSAAKVSGGGGGAAARLNTVPVRNHFMPWDCDHPHIF